jgi:enoyl-CoA hydratase/carnithine racemase
MSEDLLVARDETVATLTLNRPQRLNALDLAQWDRLGDAMVELARDDSLRVVVIRGAGEAFSSGADIAEFATLRATAAQARAYDARVQRATDAIGACPHPVVAAIDGACVGGGLEIAAACDLRIATERSRFGIPVTRLGMAAPPRELATLVTLIGVSAAMELLVEARLFDAPEALAKGLITRMVPAGGLDAELAATTRRIAAGAPLVVRIHKRLVRRVAACESLSTADIASAYGCIETKDFKAGVAGFLAKRTPRFAGM